jgi:hypothetical protein
MFIFAIPKQAVDPPKESSPEVHGTYSGELSATFWHKLHGKYSGELLAKFWHKLHGKLYYEVSAKFWHKLHGKLYYEVSEKLWDKLHGKLSGEVSANFAPTFIQTTCRVHKLKFPGNFIMASVLNFM